MTDGSSAVPLRFEILGSVRAYRGSEPVDLGPPRQQAVLAILLLHAGRPVPVHRIVAALWSGDPPENGVDVVQRYVGALRRALDPQRTSLIALTDGGYVLRADENAVDAEVFRAALARARAEHATDEIRRALDGWRDEPLAGLTGPVFEAARAQLNDERATATDLLAEPAPTRPVTADPIPTRPATAEPTPAGPAADPAFTRPVTAEPTPAGPAAEPAPTRPVTAQPAPTRPVTAEPAPTTPITAEPAPAGPVTAEPAYPAPVDPWDGHQLFPPDPLSMA
ncbi:winged helix-turn-helix domain-containing protein [Amorphoplanes digitatis]|uniref:DNA-binding winged helix-turn-helix (WHTH) protein n=1 Tax=Actinoplanes digitatis TaxID=1868 RepID=A0A7W7MSD5_9ACTN|nr:winged helix-turn-helix domain-containing protein [Actinoplanes digitatis]MBB4764647.1 DNA-binding winged helix-turn-helix (wHTH) protein [Actinoplanes digitatis]GID91402.1 hypothetical protein Adi01nite_08140 [Actinoplanes digitatis]